MTGKQEIQAIISDLKSVKEKLGKTPSRDEYQAHGSFSRHKISKHFGGFASLLKASGLEVVRKETKGEKKLREKVQKFEAEKLLQERFKKEVSPFIGKYLYKPKREILRVAASSDHHSQFLE